MNNVLTSKQTTFLALVVCANCGKFASEHTGGGMDCPAVETPAEWTSIVDSYPPEGVPVLLRRVGSTGWEWRCAVKASDESEPCVSHIAMKEYERVLIEVRRRVHEMKERHTPGLFTDEMGRLGELMATVLGPESPVRTEAPRPHIDAFLALALPRVADLMQADPEDGRELMLLVQLAELYESQKYPDFAVKTGGES
jgi:hypothetical protein